MTPSSLTSSEAAFRFRSVLKDQLHLAADIFFVLAVQLQRFIEAGRRNFQGKIPIGENRHFFQFLV